MSYRCKFFKLYELLPKELYKNEEEGWELLDEKLLRTIDVVREIVGVPLICNNWKLGGSRNLCGLRPKNCSIGAKFSAHKDSDNDGDGDAVDLISSKMTAHNMRELIKKNKDKLPYNIRLEKWDKNGNEISWLHVDIIDKGVKVYEFKA